MMVWAHLETWAFGDQVGKKMGLVGSFPSQNRPTVGITPRMENQMEKNLANHSDAGFIKRFIRCFFGFIKRFTRIMLESFPLPLPPLKGLS